MKKTLRDRYYSKNAVIQREKGNWDDPSINITAWSDMCNYDLFVAIKTNDYDDGVDHYISIENAYVLMSQLKKAIEEIELIESNTPVRPCKVCGGDGGNMDYSVCGVDRTGDPPEYYPCPFCRGKGQVVDKSKRNES